MITQTPDIKMQAMIRTLRLACKKGHADIVDAVLMDNPDIDLEVDDDFIPTFLNLAIEHGHVDVVKSLIFYGADVDFSSGCVTTPMYLAVKAGHCEIVRTLIEAGADREMISEIGEQHTALGFACYYNRLSVVKVLIDLKFDMNERDIYGATPLMVAAATLWGDNNGDVLMHLIDAGADHEIEMKDGMTARDIADEYNPHLVERMQHAIDQQKP